MMIFEFLYLMVLLIFGALVLSKLKLTGWLVAPFGFVVGLGVFITLVHLQIGLGVSSSPLIAMFIMLVTSAYMLWVKRKECFSLKYAKNAGLVAVVLFVLVGFFWSAQLAKYHYDPFRYLITANLIADDELEEISSNLNAKRLSAVSVMHSPADVYGEYYVRSIVPIVSICLLASLAWFIKELSGLSWSSRHLKLVISMAILLLLTNRSYVWHSFYLNGHLLFGAFGLLALGAGILISKQNRHDRYALLLLQCVGLAGMVLSRQEGSLLALLFIVPTTLYAVSRSDKVNWSIATPLIALGASVLLKELVLIQPEWIRGGSFVLPDKRFTLLGLMLCASPVVLFFKKLYLFIQANAKSALLLSELGLWLLLGAFAFRQPDIVSSSLSATWENLAVGKGAWGLSIILLALLVLLAIGFNKSGPKFSGYVRYPVTAFLPLALMFANLRGAAYRVGAPDSLNRMWEQILPVAVLYIAIVLLVLAKAKKDKKRLRISPAD